MFSGNVNILFYNCNFVYKLTLSENTQPHHLVLDMEWYFSLGLIKYCVTVGLLRPQNSDILNITKELDRIDR